MTRPDARPGDFRFALLASGAEFSCQVLRSLQRHSRPPHLIVLPAYRPAPRAADSDSTLLHCDQPDAFVDLAGDLEIEYAPAAAQARCARRLSASGIDFILVACWPYLLGPELIAAPRWAALNLHPSLLPRYRGPDPLALQIANRESIFGVTLHLLNAQFDRGDIVDQAEFAVTPADAQRNLLEQRCAEIGVQLFLEAMERHAQGWELTVQRV